MPSPKPIEGHAKRCNIAWLTVSAKEMSSAAIVVLTPCEPNTVAMPNYLHFLNHHHHYQILAPFWHTSFSLSHGHRDFGSGIIISRDTQSCAGYILMFLHSTPPSQNVSCYSGLQTIFCLHTGLKAPNRIVIAQVCMDLRYSSNQLCMTWVPTKDVWN